MKLCGIYCIQNLMDGKIYIGQSCDIKGRKRSHFSKLQRGIHSNKHLQAAFVQYKKNNFEFRVLEEIKENLLDIQERLWITHYKSIDKKYGYNLDDGGKLHKHHSIEMRRNLSDKMKGKKCYLFGKHLSTETRKKISIALKGKYVSKATRQKLSKANKGRPLSKEHCRKLSKAAKKRWANRTEPTGETVI